MPTLAKGPPSGSPKPSWPLAVAVGLDEIEVRDVLDSDRFADAVRSDEADAQRLQIRGVPFFVIDQRHSVSGAQPPEVLLQCLQEARPAPAAEACGPEDCPI